MRSTPIRLLPLLLLAACPVNEDTFPEDAAEQVCIYVDECENALALLGVPDVESCTRELASDYEGDPSCTFVPKKARECLSSLRELARTCDGRHDARACRDAWDCSGS